MAQTAANPCAGLRATDQGVTADEIFLAVSVVNLGGDQVNSTVGVRSATDIGEVAQAIVDQINADGGVACRKLRIKTYRVNPLEQNDQHSKCLEIVGDKPYAVLDIAGYTNDSGRSCFREAKIPFETLVIANEEEGRSSYPYLFTPQPSGDTALRNWVFGAAERGRRRGHTRGDGDCGPRILA